MDISNRLSSRQKAYETFTQRLLEQAVRPGQFVSQRELTELTGLPTSVIRELVSRLEAEGLLITVPKRGMQIAYVGIEMIREAFQFRAIIEKEAVALYAISAGADAIASIRARHAAILARCDDGMTSGASSLLLEEARTIDRTFHTTIVDAMGNSIVSDAYQVNSLKLSLIRQERGQLTMALLPQVMHDHLNIINALEKRDAPGAVVAMTAHIKRGLDRSLGNLDHWSAPHEMDRSVLGS